MKTYKEFIDQCEEVEKGCLKEMCDACYCDYLREKGYLKIDDVILPKCTHRAESDRTDEGMVCELSEHKCYFGESSYLDCYCVVMAGLCPKKKKPMELPK